jgi:predicted neuraminidase
MIVVSHFGQITGPVEEALRMIAQFVSMLLFPLMAMSQPKAEFIFEKPFPWSHAPTLLETKDGRLLAAWFGGVDSIVPHRSPQQLLAIWMAQRDANGWSAPKEVVREPGLDCANPVLFRTNDGVTWLYYKVGSGASTWTGAYCSSRDEGRTWSAGRHLAAGLYGPIKNKPLILADGAVVSGTSVESTRAWAAWVERSTDNGRTWTKHGPIVHPKHPNGIIQPSIVPIPAGRLRMFVRSQGIGYICFADSSDGGITWSDARETSLPNPNSGIDAVALKDGRIVLVYNHSGEERKRWPLNLAVSEDGGDTWNSFLELEPKPGVYAYPAIIQTSDGNIHVAYAHNTEEGPMWTPGGYKKPTQRLSGGPRIKHVEIPLKQVPWRDRQSR